MTLIDSPWSDAGTKEVIGGMRKEKGNVCVCVCVCVAFVFKKELKPRGKQQEGENVCRKYERPRFDILYIKSSLKIKNIKAPKLNRQEIGSKNSEKI